MATPATANDAKRMFLRACDELREKGSIESAILITRDGFPVAGDVPTEHREVFAAMHATALGAAELALAGGRASRGVTLIAEQEGRKFVSRGLDDSLFVVACVRPDADCHALFAWMDQLSTRLK